MHDSHPAIPPFLPELIIRHDLMDRIAVVAFIDPPGFTMVVATEKEKDVFVFFY
uniref:Uncharacterized protein n=1 Tax=Candidatus Kentrum sp. FW TaxID=2126338 RepID=A0A450U1U8_9GAMM|nr:MAG: hypothetical protein BECKFW1821C_GA0114237_110815 [Candidatus Kentron sp. FW]